MHDIAGIREGTVPADVVDVQVRVHDEVDLLHSGERLRQLAREL